MAWQLELHLESDTASDRALSLSRQQIEASPQAKDDEPNRREERLRHKQGPGLFAQDQPRNDKHDALAGRTLRRPPLPAESQLTVARRDSPGEKSS